MSLPRPIGRFVELAVFAPIGLISLICEQWPTYGKRIAQERQAVINRAQLAQLALRIAADRARGGNLGRPVLTPGAASVATEPVEPRVSPAQAADGTVSVTQANGAPSETADALPISDYESLAAIHVVHRLPTLRAGELEQIRAFELAHRARRTILAKIEQLQESTS